MTIRRTLAAAALLPALLAGLLLGAPARAEAPAGALTKPAPLPPLKAGAVKNLALMGKTKASLQAESPSPKALGVPLYPEAMFVSKTQMPTGEKVVDSYNFVTNDAPEKVLAWYRKALADGWGFDPNLKVFVKGKSGERSISMPEMMKATSVTVLSETGEAFDLSIFDLPKVKTRIQINVARDAAKK